MASQIQIVLQADVENLGAGGDIVSVRPGFARNYLIPRGFALPATKGNLARVEELKKQALAASQLALETAKALKAKVEATSIKLARKVGADSRMYGSVTVKDIEEAYKAEGLTIDRRKIELTDAIKALGLSDVKVKLHPEVDATLRVEVVKA
jgi:large subunit ribosomal protein L9